MKGPWVSGPWLVVWGGNAKALNRPTFYTVYPLFFLLCGTMFPRKLVFAGHMAASRTLDAIEINKGGVDQVDPSPRDHDHATCVKRHLSDLDQCLTL